MKKMLYVVLVLVLTTVIGLAGCTNTSDETSSWKAGQESAAISDLPEESDASNVKTGENITGTGSMTSGAKTSGSVSGGQNITSKSASSGALSSKTASGISTSSGSTVPSGSNKAEAAENNGEVACYDGWIYYLKTNTPRTNKYNLYKMRENGSEKTKLIDDLVSNFYVADGWIYYSIGSIYKMKTDGSGKEKLFSNDLYYPTNIIVEGGWIYWINIRKNTSNAFGEICKMRTDGTEQKQFGSPENTANHAANMTVVNGWVYYIDWRGSTGSGTRWSAGYLSKIRTDGTSNSRLNEDTIDFYTVDNDWIFYCNVSDHGKIYKMHTDGTGDTKISDNGAYSINIYDNWIYYCGPMDRSTDSFGKTYSIYKMKKDGTEIKEIGSSILRTVRAVNGWIYCINADWSMYRIRTDGTDKQQI